MYTSSNGAKSAFDTLFSEFSAKKMILFILYQCH